MARIVPRLGRRSGVQLAIGMALASLALASAPAIAAPPAAAATPHPYAASVTEAAQRFGIPESWIWSVMRVESRGNSRAVSPVGAMGLMQIMPATWTMLSARFGLGGDAFDVRANIHAGAAYLRMMWDRYGNVSAMLAAYNAGPRRADAWVARGNRLPAETVAYVARIAPVIGNGSAVSDSVPTAIPSLSWRSASVFAERGDSVSVVPSHAEISRPATQTNPLFVALSGGKRP